MTLGPRSRELLSASRGPLSEATPAGPYDLSELLAHCNGFYAFEGALHLLPSGADEGHMTLEAWNDPGGWRADYGQLADGLFFFAEDALGGQFALRNGSVYTFDPETGRTEQLASGLEDWPDQLLDDYEVMTAYPSRTTGRAGRDRCRKVNGSFRRPRSSLAATSPSRTSTRLTRRWGCGCAQS